MADTKAHCIEVCAEVRYWEDADVNGVDDTDGTLIPFRVGNLWKPLIRLDDGYIIGWPEGTTASIHYKVCDQGEYWLTDESQERIAKWKGDYVPDEFLCVGDNGYGDYIIFKVGADGKIAGWTLPDIVDKEWVLLPVDNDDLAQVMKAHPTRVTAAGVALLQQEIERLKATPLPADAALAKAVYGERVLIGTADKCDIWIAGEYHFPSPPKNSEFFDPLHNSEQSMAVLCWLLNCDNDNWTLRPYTYGHNTPPNLRAAILAAALRVVGEK